jgi:hypothetical protein
VTISYRDVKIIILNFILFKYLERESKTKKREFLDPRVTNITSGGHNQKGLSNLLSPHGLHWPTVDEGLDTAALTSVSLMLLGHRNATTGGSGNRNNLLEYKEKISTNGFPLFSLTIPL